MILQVLWQSQVSAALRPGDAGQRQTQRVALWVDDLSGSHVPSRLEQSGLIVTFVKNSRHEIQFRHSYSTSMYSHSDDLLHLTLSILSKLISNACEPPVGIMYDRTALTWSAGDKHQADLVWSRLQRACEASRVRFE